MTASSTDWRCTRCGESIPPTFEACWNCGTTRDGLRDLFFQPERDVADDSYDEPASTDDSQYSLRDLFGLTTEVAIGLGAVLTIPLEWYCFFMLAVAVVAPFALFFMLKKE